jgi:hypothetical protein
MVLSFLLSGGIAGQQYNVTVATLFSGGSRQDVLTVNMPSSQGSCETINPVPALYTQLPLGTQGYVNTGVRYFWGAAPPANPTVLDQWFDPTTNTLSEWATDGVSFFWEELASDNLVTEAPIDNIIYGRYNGFWVQEPIQVDAPSNGQQYARKNAGWSVVTSSGGGGGGGGGAGHLLNHMERLTITTVNVLPPLSFTPDGSLLMLVVNGATFTPNDGSFTFSGTTITWRSTIYSLNPSDMVVAIYSYSVPSSLLNKMDLLAVTTTNAFPPLSFTPDGSLLMLIVNGATFTPTDGSFTFSGTVITWVSTIYSVHPGDTVVAVYSYMG